jgi:hypothetical protein
MRTISRFGSIAAVFVMLGSLVLAAPKAQRANKYFTIAGTVLNVDQKEHTLLVADRRSEKLYLVEIPDGATFKITFGRYMRMAEPGFADVNVRERVEIRCIRGDRDHLAQLDDGREVVVLTAAN